METYKPQPFEERQSQKVNFWKFTKEKLFWGVLPLLTAGGAMLFGKLTKFKVFPLDGSTDLLSHAYAKGLQLFSKKHNIEGTEEVAQWVNKGAWVGELIDHYGGETKETMRKYYFNFIKGAEVATPFSAYFLWHKKEGNRLDLEDAGDKLKRLQALKPSDAELAEHNEAMRRELEFSVRTAEAPGAVIDKSDMEYHGRLAAVQKQRL